MDTVLSQKHFLNRPRKDIPVHAQPNTQKSNVDTGFTHRKITDPKFMSLTKKITDPKTMSLPKKITDHPKAIKKITDPKSMFVPKKITEAKSMSLLALMPLDAACAMVSATIVTPFVAVIDKAIFVSASTDVSLSRAMANETKGFLKAPLKFTKTPAFRWVWSLYVATYLVANTVETVCEKRDINPVAPKFFSSASVNVALSVLKDRALTTGCGKGVPHPIARTTLGLYALRDTLTVFSSFTLPPHVSDHLTSQYGFPERSSALASQFLAPAAAQAICAPLHLYGMDIYNNPERSARERFRFATRAYMSTTAFRMARIIPAFGLGGVTNGELRERGRNSLVRLANQQSEEMQFQQQKFYGRITARAESAHPSIITGLGKFKRLLLM